MKKVLYITNQYPPAATGGVFRSLSFTNRLKIYHWHPTVLTNKTNHNWTNDPGLLKKTQKNVAVVRTKEWNTLYLHILLSKIKLGSFYNLIENKLFIPDKKIGWLPTAIHKGDQLIQSQNFDLIFSTSPSICSHIIAMKLSTKYNLPWICEFRDLWTMLPTYKFKQSKRGNIEQKMEHKFLKEAKKVILVSKTFKAQFIQQYPSLPPDKFAVIYNGFENLNPIKKATNNHHLTIIYTGSMYGDYYPSELFEKLNKLILKQPKIKIKIKFIGKVEYKIMDVLDQYKTVETEFLGFRSKDELPKLLETADALLLFQMGRYISIPSKVFDYLAYQKPILAIVQDQELTEIVSATNMAYCANPNSPGEIEQQVLKLHRDWQTNSLPRVENTDPLYRYSRQHQCSQLAKIFDEVT